MRAGRSQALTAHVLIARRAAIARALGIGCAVGMSGYARPQLALAAQTSYPQVRQRTLVFPRDFGAHSEFRTEWWYLTGWLAQGGQSVGFQVTFFRSRTQHSNENPSRFAPRQLLFAHAALAFSGRKALMHADRAARAGSAGAGFSETDTDVQIGSWQMRRVFESGKERYLADIDANDFSLRIVAQPPMAPVLRGSLGYSRKGPLPEQASFYYSRPQLQATASLSVSGREQQYSGLAWLDHEWSSSLLMQGASGWDWIGINLIDGGSLMAFRIRDSQGNTLWRHVDWRDAKGRVVAQSYRNSEWVPRQRWRSARSLIEYPVGFRLEIEGRAYEIVPLMQDQEVDARSSTGGFYWEGAVTLFDGKAPIGRGYLELTGYGEPLAL